MNKVRDKASMKTQDAQGNIGTTHSKPTAGHRAPSLTDPLEGCKWRQSAYDNDEIKSGEPLLRRVEGTMPRFLTMEEKNTLSLSWLNRDGES